MFSIQKPIWTFKMYYKFIISSLRYIIWRWCTQSSKDFWSQRSFRVHTCRYIYIYGVHVHATQTRYFHTSCQKTGTRDHPKHHLNVYFVYQTILYYSADVYLVYIYHKSNTRRRGYRWGDEGARCPLVVAGTSNWSIDPPFCLVEKSRDIFRNMCLLIQIWFTATCLFLFRIFVI